MLLGMAAQYDDLDAEELDYLDAQGMTFLHYCSMFHLAPQMEMLLNKGANPEVLLSQRIIIYFLKRNHYHL